MAFLAGHFPRVRVWWWVCRRLETGKCDDRGNLVTQSGESLKVYWKVEAKQSGERERKGGDVSQSIFNTFQKGRIKYEEKMASKWWSPSSLHLYEAKVDKSRSCSMLDSLIDLGLDSVAKSLHFNWIITFLISQDWLQPAIY